MRQKTDGGQQCQPCSQCNQTQIQSEFAARANPFKWQCQENGCLHQLYQVGFRGQSALNIEDLRLNIE
jgi:hypothetical protein